MRKMSLFLVVFAKAIDNHLKNLNFDEKIFSYILLAMAFSGRAKRRHTRHWLLRRGSAPHLLHVLLGLFGAARVKPGDQNSVSAPLAGNGDLGLAKATIDKSSRLPAYAQMANSLRSSISSGDYPPGARLPAESALAKAYGVSAMTARQAVSVLEEEGLVRRMQGKGTFVRKIGVATSSFGLDALAAIIADRENLTVRIVEASVKKTPGNEKKLLGLSDHTPVIEVQRIILHRNEPFTLHVSYTSFDPRSPSVESMLDTVVLTGLIFQEGYSNFKRGVLRLLPTQLEAKEAELLDMDQGESAFKLEHLFFDFDDKPAAFGWFLVSHEKMPLISKVGVWDD